MLEGIAFQVYDLVNAMEKVSGYKISSLKVDGGASVSDFMLAFQADILNADVDRPEITETTAMGAAFLAGLGAGIWKSRDGLRFARKTQRVFKPSMNKCQRENAVNAWHNAVSRALSKR